MATTDRPSTPGQIIRRLQGRVSTWGPYLEVLGIVCTVLGLLARHGGAFATEGAAALKRIAPPPGSAGSAPVKADETGDGAEADE